MGRLTYEADAKTTVDGFRWAMASREVVEAKVGALEDEVGDLRSQFVSGDWLLISLDGIRFVFASQLYQVQFENSSYSQPPCVFLLFFPLLL